MPRHFFDRKNSKDALESKIIRNKENTFSIKATIKEGTVIEDVGIIVKSRHPNNPDKFVVILAGAYSYGTLAAAKFVTDENLLRECEPTLDSDRFEIIVTAITDNYEVPEITKEWDHSF